MIAPALETRALCKHFGALQVARSIDFLLYPGARRALIGPNGAGKTTFINLITGTLPPTRGKVFLMGRDVTRHSEAVRVKHGLARTFQINTLFQGLSVLENICLAISERSGVAVRMLRPVGRRSEVIDEAWQLLQTLRLEADALRPVSALAYGRQRLVEIGIALGLRPRILLLDEPAAGVPSAESHILLDAFEKLPRDLAVLIVEHDMDVVFRFAHEITVLVDGAILLQGSPEEVAADPRVREVYLGTQEVSGAR